MLRKELDRYDKHASGTFTAPLSIHLFLILLCLVIPPGQGFAAGNPAILKNINERLEKTQDPQAKSKLYVYRARYYQKDNKSEQAIIDYGMAITLNHQSWIHLERAGLLYSIKEYERARQEAQAAKDENPGLTDQADAIANKADAHLQKIEEQNNPEEIVLDREIDPYRNSRFDIPWSGTVVKPTPVKVTKTTTRKKTIRKKTVRRS